MYPLIYFEICGFCNAQCKYCQTGRDRLQKKHISEKFVDFEKFKKGILHLLDRKLINNDTLIALFNWGEPTLHPNYREIIMFLKEQNLRTTISTNSAKLVLFDPKIHDLSHIVHVTASLPGFSQESYDKGHKFDFETIKTNLKLTVDNMRECGFRGSFSLFFLVYQYNMDEYKDALDFAIKNEINIEASPAFMNDSKRTFQYFTNKTPYDELMEISRDLILYPSVRGKPPIFDKDYYCHQNDMLVIDSDCNVITCCSDSTVYKNVLDVRNKEEVINWHMHLKACWDCKDTGVCGLITLLADRDSKYSVKKKYFENIFPTANERIISKIIDLKLRSQCLSIFFEKYNYKNIAIYGAGTQGKFLYFELKNSNIKVNCFIDRNEGAFDDVPIINIDDVGSFMIDAVVITTQTFEYYKVIEELKKITSIPVIPLTEIIHFLDYGKKGHYIEELIEEQE